MSFVTLLALAVGVFVAAPVLAHLLRRRRTDERLFPPAKLISATPPTARRRSMLEDRALFALRAVSVLALALLGATPFVSCSHISLQRKDGASVALAIVVDDSLSMRATADGQSRFDRAKRAAIDLVAQGRSGDSFAVVLAGAPPRVAMASTTDLESARTALSELEPSDRATDLEGAIHLATDLVKALPQRDKRVALLSDLADGSPSAAPLATDGEVVLWNPLPDITSKGEQDCGLVAADRADTKVTVRIACTEGASVAKRKISIVGADQKTLAETTPKEPVDVVSLDVDKDAPEVMFAVIAPGDAIAADDHVPVAARGTDFRLGVVADAAENRLETGGPPPIEQALTALDLGSVEKPLPAMPEHEEDLKGLAGIVVDDPPGFTPEARKAIEGWVEKGGELVVTLGRTANAAPLGAGFGGLFPGVVRWGASSSRGAAPETCSFLGVAAEGLRELHLNGRASLDHAALEGAEVLCAFDDGAPLVIRRALGRGSVIIVTLPFGIQESDLPLRPAFLSLVDRFVDEARARSGTRHVDVGQSFTFTGVKQVSGKRVGSAGDGEHEVSVVERDGFFRATPDTVGRYLFTVDGAAETRVATVPVREIDMRARAVAESASNPALGGKAPRLDASPYVALVLLGLFFVELLLRVIAARGAPSDGESAAPPADAPAEPVS